MLDGEDRYALFQVWRQKHLACTTIDEEIATYRILLDKKLCTKEELIQKLVIADVDDETRAKLIIGVAGSTPPDGDSVPSNKPVNEKKKASPGSAKGKAANSKGSGEKKGKGSGEKKAATKKTKDVKKVGPKAKGKKVVKKDAKLGDEAGKEKKDERTPLQIDADELHGYIKRNFKEERGLFFAQSKLRPGVRLGMTHELVTVLEELHGQGRITRKYEWGGWLVKWWR